MGGRSPRAETGGVGGCMDREVAPPLLMLLTLRSLRSVSIASAACVASIGSQGDAPAPCSLSRD